MSDLSQYGNALSQERKESPRAPHRAVPRAPKRPCMQANGYAASMHGGARLRRAALADTSTRRIAPKLVRISTLTLNAGDSHVESTDCFRGFHSDSHDSFSALLSSVTRFGLLGRGEYRVGLFTAELFFFKIISAA